MRADELIAVDPQLLVNLFMTVAVIILIAAIVILLINKFLMKLIPKSIELKG